MSEEFRVTRALSLTQPWATLVAIGAKQFETRSWRSDYIGWLAIQASKGFPAECRELCFNEPFKSALPCPGWGHLPRGQVIAVVWMSGCRSTNNWTPVIDSNEYAFGDYSEDRYAWEFLRLQRIKPFDAKGSLGIWKLPRALTAEDLL